MNWVLILVIAVLVGYTIAGYAKGFLKIAYSLISWLLMLIFVIGATPYIENYLRNETPIYEKMVTYCEDKVRHETEEQIEAGEGNTFSSIIEENELLALLVENLPKEAIGQILNQTTDAAEQFLEENNFYGKAAVSMADLMMKGVAFVLALVLGSLLSAIIAKLIGFISNLPLIGFANSLLGMAAGAINGLLIVWFAFYLIATWSATELGATILSYIYANEFLIALYEKNIILAILMK